MLKIGEFAALSSISIHMLRNYDKIGLLSPDYVEEWSGYRYYDASKLVQANQIVALKSMGFGLDEIKTALQKTPEEFSLLLQDKLLEKQEEAKRLEQQMMAIRESIHFEPSAGAYAFSVVLKSMPAVRVVSLRETIHEFAEEGRLWHEISEECERLGVAAEKNSLAMAILHSVDWETHEIDAEVQISVPRKQKSCGKLSCIDYPEREVASIVFQGAYPQIGKVNTFLAEWLQSNQFEIAGEFFSIYHNSPRESQNPADFVTELCVPVLKKSIDSRTM